jgi:hypothetical protein
MDDQLLYHYTDVQGFKGIVDSRELWATHIQYLNDTQEYLYAVGVARRVLGEQVPTAADPQEGVVLSRLGTELSLGRRVYVGVASFSELDDGLSQWRDYCPNGAGYSLGFVTEDLIRLGRQQGFYLARCLYDDASQTQAIAQALEEVRHSVQWAAALEHQDPDEAYGAAASVWLDRFTRLAPTIKHRAFHGEQEWRLISVPMPFSDGRWRVRPGRSMLIPYLPITLAPPSGSVPIAEIVVGPTPHRELALTAVGVLFDPQRELEPLYSPILRQPAQFRISRVPYRPWT